MALEMNDKTMPQSGTTVALGTSAITFRVVGAETGGAYSVLEYLAAPGAGSGSHRHRHEDETFYLISGAMTFEVDGTRRRIGPGEMITVPVGTRHAFANTEAEEARAVIILRPAGLEGFFADMAALLAAYPGGPPGAEVARIADRYDLDFS